MSDAAAQMPRMTVEEFLDWSEQREGRYELYDGEVVTMQSERVGHAVVKLSVYTAFRDALRSDGNGSKPFGDGVTVKVDRWTAFEPDCTIHCGAVDLNAVIVDNPVVVVEVVSPSSRAIDLIRKLPKYFQVASIQHYLVVESEKRTIIHHSRSGDGITVRIQGTGTLTLEPPGITVEGGD